MGEKTILATYKAITRPILNYVPTIWSPIASDTNINKLQITQNTAPRIVTGCTTDTNTQHLHDETHIVVCLPIPMEGMGRLQFSDLFSQNYQFHHRRLESLEHLMCLIYILLSTTVSHFWTLRMPFFLQGLLFFVYISILQVHFACVLCI